MFAKCRVRDSDSLSGTKRKAQGAKRTARNYNIYPFNLRARGRKERRAETLSIRALTRRCTFVSRLTPPVLTDDKLAR